MLLDFCRFERKAMPAQPRPPHVRLTRAERLARAVQALAGPRAVLARHIETPWASVTFSGARHTLVLRFDGWEACDDAERLIAALPEHEFQIGGALVADAAVTRTDQQLLPEPRMEVEVDLLLLEDK